MRIIAMRGTPRWAADAFRSIERAFSQQMDAPFRLKTYAVADRPDAAEWIGGLIYLSNEAGGAVIAFSDGVNWRRVTDRAIVS